MDRSDFLVISSTSSQCLVLGSLSHAVQGAAVLEPLNLASVESVRQGDIELGTVLGVNAHGDGLANSKLRAQDVDLSGMLAKRS